MERPLKGYRMQFLQLYKIGLMMELWVLTEEMAVLPETEGLTGK
jgi:hypothetical protein